MRGILEASIFDVWKWWPERPTCEPSVASRLAALLDEREGCVGLKAYVRVAAEDNNVSPDATLAEARKLCSTFCGDVPEEERPTGFSFAALVGPGRVALVAYTALLHFSGRQLSRYVSLGSGKLLSGGLTMRTMRFYSATEATIRASRKLKVD